MNLLTGLMAASLLAGMSTLASAQQRPDIPGIRITGSGAVDITSAVPITLPSANAYIPVHCGNTTGFSAPNAPGCSGLGRDFTFTYVSISQFATASELANLQANMEIAQSGLQQTLEDRADDSAALAGALDFVAPAEGAAHRIGAQAFTMGDRAAIGATYTQRAGPLDLGIGFSSTGNRAAAKVGAGFSW